MDLENKSNNSEIKQFKDGVVISGLSSQVFECLEGEENKNELCEQFKKFMNKKF